MQVREKSGQTLTEPITYAQMKVYMGSDEIVEAVFNAIIKPARIWLEKYTGCSVISKIYEVEFERDDGYENWYELPFYPVTSITTVQIDSTDVDYYEKGQTIVEIYPQSAISTGTSDNTLDVEFIAGASNTLAVEALYRMVSDLYNTRTTGGGDVSTVSFQWDTMSLINQLSKNTNI